MSSSEQGLCLIHLYVCTESVRSPLGETWYVQTIIQTRKKVLWLENSVPNQCLATNLVKLKKKKIPRAKEGLSILGLSFCLSGTWSHLNPTIYLFRNKLGDEDQLYTQSVLELMLLSQGFHAGSFKNANLHFFNEFLFSVFTVCNKKISWAKNYKKRKAAWGWFAFHALFIA